MCENVRPKDIKVTDSQAAVQLKNSWPINNVWNGQ